MRPRCHENFALADKFALVCDMFEGFKRELKAWKGALQSKRLKVNVSKTKMIMKFNPFVPNAPFLFPLKTPESRKFLVFSVGRERVYRERMG